MIKRILAIMIDSIGLILISLIFLALYIVIVKGNDDVFNIVLVSNSAVLSLLIYTIYKDFIFKNQSIGKRIVGIEIVFIDGSIPKHKDLFIRNVFWLFNIVEIFMLIIARKRLGEIVSKTCVVEKNKLV